MSSSPPMAPSGAQVVGEDHGHLAGACRDTAEREREPVTGGRSEREMDDRGDGANGDRQRARDTRSESRGASAPGSP